jgi:hypothetical protein
MLRSKEFALNLASSSTKLQQEHLNGLNASEMARNLWTIVNILVDRPHAQLWK